MDGDEIQQWQQLVREVLVAPPVQDYAIRLVLATHPEGAFAVADTNKYIRCGASPRGAQALVLAGKVRALLEGRYNVEFRGHSQGVSAGAAASHSAQLRGPGGEHSVG